MRLSKTPTKLDTRRRPLLSDFPKSAATGHAYLKFPDKGNGPSIRPHFICNTWRNLLHADKLAGCEPPVSEKPVLVSVYAFLAAVPE